jgi:hypothetical protein
VSRSTGSGAVGGGGPTRRIAELDSAEQALLDKSELAGLDQGRMHHGLTAGSLGDAAVAVDNRLQGAKLVLDPAGSLEQVKLTGIEPPAVLDVSRDRLPQFFASRGEAPRRLQNGLTHPTGTSPV